MYNRCTPNFYQHIYKERLFTEFWCKQEVCRKLLKINLEIFNLKILLMNMHASLQNARKCFYQYSNYFIKYELTGNGIQKSGRAEALV